MISNCHEYLLVLHCYHVIVNCDKVSSFLFHDPERLPGAGGMKALLLRRKKLLDALILIIPNYDDL